MPEHTTTTSASTMAICLHRGLRMAGREPSSLLDCSLARQYFATADCITNSYCCHIAFGDTAATVGNNCSADNYHSAVAEQKSAAQ